MPSVKEILNCLFSCYGTVAPSNLKTLKRQVEDYHFNPSEPINVWRNRSFFHQPKKKERKKNYGEKSFSEDEELLLTFICQQFPRAPLTEYCNLLFMYSGKRVSRSTICSYLKHSLLFKSSMRKTSVFPHNKYTAFNIIRINNYINFVVKINPCRLVFTDEKPLRGNELYKANARRHPITGDTPHIQSTVKLKNKFNLMAAVKISGQENENLFYQIGKYKATSFVFKSFVLDMVRSNYLQPGDILVCDNASIHTRDECTHLREELMMFANVYILLLPAYHPELNPIELVFNMLAQRIRHSNARYEDYVNQQDVKIMHLACTILNEITTDDIRKMYRKCGYIHWQYCQWIEV